MRVFLLLVFLSLFFLRGGEGRWYGDYERARRTAIEEGKGLLVYLVEPESGQELIRQVASAPKIRRELFHRYVPVVLLAVSQSRYPIELYYTTQFPAIFFMDPKREVPLHPPIKGLKLVEELRRILK